MLNRLYTVWRTHRGLRHATWILPLIWMGLLHYLLTAEVDVESSAWGFPHVDKLAHAFFFGGLAWLLVPPCRYSLRWTLAVSLAAAFLLSSVYGGIMEYWQTFLPHRHGNWADVVANAVGAATVFLLIPLLRWRRTLSA